MRIFIQLIAILFSGIGFSVLFNVRGYRVFLNACGASLAWGLYLLIHLRVQSVFWTYFVVTMLMALLCEGLARLTRTPTVLMIVPMIVPPLIPGSDLYNTCYHLITGEMQEMMFYGTKLALEIAAINFAIILAGTIVKLTLFLQKGVRRRIQGKS